SSRTTVYTFPGEFADIELTKLLVKSGKIRASTISTVEDTIQFQYSITSALNSMEEIPAVNIKLNPAPPHGVSTQVVERDLGGFVIDMTDGGTTYNTIREKIKVTLLESGNLVTLDQTDSISVEFGLIEIEPTYIEGYIGQEKFTFSGQRSIDLFETLDVKKLKFADPKAKIVFASSLGVNANVEVKDFTAVNSKTGQRTPLNGTPLLAGPVVIQSPELPDTNSTVFTEVEFNRDNSNIPTFINLLANELSYDIAVVTNPGVKAAFHDNFATENSQISAYVDFELPLEGIVEELKMGDTTGINFGKVDFNQIQGADLRIIIENQFPFMATITATILDENKELIAVLSDNQTIEA
ncbi:MAG: hypothetical protein KDD63_15950, partial [Bacteroidetes bacterium]|nr:hypothetical protein [Bacteroidota bacterium]